MKTLLSCAIACLLLAGMPLTALAVENNTAVAKAIPAVVTIVADPSLTGRPKLRIDPIGAAPGGRPAVISTGAPAPLKAGSGTSDTQRPPGYDY